MSQLDYAQILAQVIAFVFDLGPHPANVLMNKTGFCRGKALPRPFYLLTRN
jgi:hypothetical protein